ncbi:hypothetical protein BACCIP111883_01853 [Sutcliffiella rhizosphaerae]|uniref:Spore germination GerAC-like C-terminal domain-containing protein n=1 Tax=Sutcliffiella rhizosphaerae TaxID=2880967 RepID=A0ABN8AAZ0_9BACI|nr:hypothetical protein BACCIP111883_01853 [Sutcliffiella rhizosphaerae]
MFSKLQESGADILGLGQYFRKRLSRQEWRKWRTDFYPILKYKQQVVVHIQNEGNLKMMEN